MYLVPVPVWIKMNNNCAQNEVMIRRDKAAWRGHFAIGIIIFGTGTSFDFKKLTTVVFKWRS
jgi:hypothetical protein